MTDSSAAQSVGGVGKAAFTDAKWQYTVVVWEIPEAGAKDEGVLSYSVRLSPTVPPGEPVIGTACIDADTALT